MTVKFSISMTDQDYAWVRSQVDTRRYPSVSALIADLVAQKSRAADRAELDTEYAISSTVLRDQAQPEAIETAADGWLLAAWSASESDPDAFIANADRAMRYLVNRATLGSSLRRTSETTGLSVGSVRTIVDGQTPSFDKFLRLVAATGGMGGAIDPAARRSTGKETARAHDDGFILRALSTLLARTESLDTAPLGGAGTPSDAEPDAPAAAAGLAVFRLGESGPMRRMVFPPAIDAELFVDAVYAAFGIGRETAPLSMRDEGLAINSEHQILTTVRDGHLLSLLDASQEGDALSEDYLFGRLLERLPIIGVKLVSASLDAGKLRGALKLSDTLDLPRRVRCIDGSDPDGMLDLDEIDRRISALPRPAGLSPRPRQRGRNASTRSQ